LSEGKRPRGRPVGSGDRAKVLAKTRFQVDMIEWCRREDLDPIREYWNNLALIDDPAIKAKLLLDLFEFIYPKRKAIEHTLDLGGGQAGQLSHAEIKLILSADPFALPEPDKGNNG